MVVTVLGKYKKPYSIDGKNGVSYRVSLSCGEYLSDVGAGIVGEGSQFIEVKCPEDLFELVNINDQVYVSLDDGKFRIKDYMLLNSDGSFSPVN